MTAVRSGPDLPGHERWRRRARPLLGTFVEIALKCPDPTMFEPLGALAFDRIAQFHARMSFHDAGSDVRAIAAARAGERVTVSPDTWAVLERALAFEDMSGGVFNIAVAPALVGRGALPSPSLSPGDVGVARATSARAALRLEPGHAVRVLRPVWIDIGGIAKGAAVDAALAVLRVQGASAAVVNAGGDIAVFGDEDIPLEVVGPGRRRVLAGWLAEGAAATSGPYTPDEDVDPTSHLVLPHRMNACWADRAVTVIAPTCLVADALTKIVAALGPASASLLAHHGAQGLSVDRDGTIERVGPPA